MEQAGQSDPDAEADDPAVHHRRECNADQTDRDGLSQRAHRHIHHEDRVQECKKGERIGLPSGQRVNAGKEDDRGGDVDEWVGQAGCPDRLDHQPPTRIPPNDRPIIGGAADNLEMIEVSGPVATDFEAERHEQEHRRHDDPIELIAQPVIRRNPPAQQHQGHKRQKIDNHPAAPRSSAATRGAQTCRE